MQSLQFRNQLDSLMESLNKTEPQYIRCIKSNSAKKPNTYESEICLQQLRYAGVFEAVRVRQLGFPFRYKHAVFYMRYRCIGTSKFLTNLPPGGVNSSFNFKQGCKDLLDDVAVYSPEKITPVDKVFKFGKTMMLYRADQHRRLEAMREAIRETSAVLTERVFRGHRARKIARVLRAAREFMRAAIRARDLALVKTATAEAKTLPYKLAEGKVLTKLEAQLVAETTLRSRLAALLPQEPEEAFDAYKKALDEGKALSIAAVVDYPSLDPSLLLTADPSYIACEQKFASVELRKQAKKKLEEAMARGDASTILAALRDADGAGADLVSAAARQAAKEAIEAMERDAEVLKMLTASVARGGISGPVGAPSPHAVITAELEDAERGISSGALASSTPRFATLASTVRLLLDLRRRLLAALAAPPLSSTAAWEQVGAAAEAAVAAQGEGKLASEADAEVAAVGAEVSDRRVQLSLINAMSKGAARGELGAMALSTADPTGVTEAVAAAAALGSSDGGGSGGLSAVAKRLHASAELVRKLRVAQVAADWKAIRAVAEEALNPATGKPPLESVALAEFAAAKDEVDNHTIVRELTDALNKGFASGSAGVLDTSTIDVALLGEKSDAAAKMGTKTAQAGALLRLARHVRRLRQALLAADAAGAGSGAGQEILDAVAAARNDVPREFMPPFTAEKELVVAEAHGQNLLLMATLREALVMGGPSGAVGRVTLPPVTPANNKIAEALALCKKFRAKNGEAQALERAVAALKDVRDAFAKREWEGLQAALLAMKDLHGARMARRVADFSGEASDAGVVLKGKAGGSNRASMSALVAAVAEERAAAAAAAAAAAVGGGGGNGGPGAEAEGAAAAAQWSGARRTAIRQLGRKRLSEGTAPQLDGEEEGIERFRLPVEALAELALLQAELYNHLIVVDLGKALLNGTATGPLGALALSSIETDALSFALKRTYTEREGAKTPLAAALAYTGQVVRELRAYLREGDWTSVESTLRSVASNNARVARGLGRAIPLGSPSGGAAGFGGSSSIGGGLASPSGGGGGEGFSPGGTNSAGGFIPSSLLGPVEVSAHAELPDLSTAMDLARVTLVMPGLAEVVRVEAEAQYRRVIEGMLTALSCGSATGAPGRISLASLDTAALAAQIDAARALGARTPRAQQLSVLCRLMWQLRTAVSEDDWAAVESLLTAGAPLVAAAAAALPSAPGAADAAPLPGMLHAELKLYSEEASNRRTIASLRNAVLNGGPVGAVGKLVLSGVDVSGLEASVRAALAAGVITEESKQLFASAVHLRALRLCLLGGSWVRLGELLDFAAGARGVAKAYSLSAAAAAAGGGGQRGRAWQRGRSVQHARWEGQHGLLARGGGPRGGI